MSTTKIQDAAIPVGLRDAMVTPVVRPAWLTAARILAWLAALALLAFAGDRVLASILDRVVLASNFRYSVLYSGGDGPRDIVILGNSRGVNGFHAPTMQERLNVDALNLGYNGVASDVAAVLFDDYLRLNAAPRMVIIEVTNIAGKDEALNDFRIYLRHSNGLAQLTEQQSPKVLKATSVTHLFSYNSEMMYRAMYYLRKSDQGWINSGHLAPALITAVDTMQDAPLPLERDRLAAIVHTVRAAREHGSEVRLIVTPYFAPYVDKITNLDAWIRAVEDATGERVWDYSRALDEPADFADRLHINRAGSTRLLDALVSDGFFGAMLQ